MKRLPRMPQWLEATLVLGAAFGYPVFVSLSQLLLPTPDAEVTEAGLQWLLLYELVSTLLLWGFLHLRGWRLDAIGLRPGLLDTGFGLGLASACYLVITLLWSLTAAIFSRAGLALEADLMPDAEAASAPVSALYPLTIVAVSIVNPLFEELFVCAYLVTVLKRRGSVWLAINLSVLLRLIYHLYQGLDGVVAMIPIGFVFALWYSRTGRLWPLVVAHAAFDFLALNEI